MLSAPYKARGIVCFEKTLDNRRKMWYINLNVVKKSADFADLPEREWCRRLRAPEQMKNAFRFGAESGKGSF